MVAEKLDPRLTPARPDLAANFHGRPLGEALLEPTRIYVKPLLALMQAMEVKGLVHITGGGLVENVPRVMPDGLQAVMHRDHPLAARASVRVRDCADYPLVLPNREVWTFEAPDDKVELEESVFLAGNDGPRRTTQIVVRSRDASVHSGHGSASVMFMHAEHSFVCAFRPRSASASDCEVSAGCRSR
mgnify:CR=1 FL=1